MIMIKQLKLNISHGQKDLEHKIMKKLGLRSGDLLSYQIDKCSIDARKKKEIQYVYTVRVSLKNEERVLKNIRDQNISKGNIKPYQFPYTMKKNIKHRPVIIGSGPAGLFCAYILAKHGISPIIVERGRMVDKRKQDVLDFWETNQLNIHSNVQFGEGGAGTFSDGKLNTLVKDVYGRNKLVLDTLIEMGAGKEIAYKNKPHIGTDVLIRVVRNMREAILEMGGTFYFETKVTDLKIKENQIESVLITHLPTNHVQEIQTKTVVLAIGHSARDTFEMLYEKGIIMEQKDFAVGLRIEHPQAQINFNQYGEEAAKKLPAADYKLNTKLLNERSVYSFCMCPGGYVVNASSEKNKLAVNGMSYSKRDGKNANSAIIVTVTGKDFNSSHPLAGIEFQRELEHRAFEIGEGKIPQQLFGDFIEQKISNNYGSYKSAHKGAVRFSELHTLFQSEIYQSLVEGIHHFSKHIHQFDRNDCILSGVESRTSSPVRITRDDHLESNRKGIYPCGEGAGYAGGIMSAAMDGLKVAEAIAKANENDNIY